MPKPKLAPRFLVLDEVGQALTNMGMWTLNHSLARRFPSFATAERQARHESGKHQHQHRRFTVKPERIED